MKNMLTKSALITGLFAVAPFLAGAQSPTLSFSANPQNVNEGEAVTISWFSQNTDYCTASGDWHGTYVPFGNRNVFPKENSNYAITCTGEHGSVYDVKSVFVTKNGVNPPGTPVVTNYNYTYTGGTIPAPQPQPITPSQPAAFSAACAVSPSVVEVGKSVTFAAAQSGGSSPYTYQWSGDVVGTGQTRAVSFTTTGTKTAKVSVYDSQSRLAEGNCSVEVKPASPAPSLAPTPVAATKPKIVTAAVTAPTCKTVTLCIDTAGNVYEQKSGETPKSGETSAPKEEVAKENGAKSFLASIFSTGSTKDGERLNTLVKWYAVILIIAAILAGGYFAWRLAKKG